MLLFRHDCCFGVIRALAAIVLCSGCNASSSDDKCLDGQSRCADNAALEFCAAQNPNAADPEPLVWFRRPCIGQVCVQLDPAHAICVPHDAYPDPVCANYDGTFCRGTSILSCARGGYVVGEQGCRTCDQSWTSAGAPGTAQCTGSYGATCTSSADCRDGLACHSDGSGNSVCTVPCVPDPDASAPDAAVAVPSSDCLVPQGDGGIWGRLHIAITPALCLDGYCR